jgi:hemerythrin-like domain-containing protein
METITDLLAQDHDRLDDLFRTFQSLKATELSEARHAFSAFKIGLQRHIVWEEEILFSIFEERTGMVDAGPTAVMRLEHRRIKDLLEDIHGHLGRGEIDTKEQEAALLTVLADHNAKEEGVLYPWFDRSLSEDLVRDVLRRMRELPEDRFHQCCA